MTHQNREVALGKTLSLLAFETSHLPVSTSQLQISGRLSFLLKYQDSVGLVYGEASPLLGYGDDDVFLCEQDLLTLSAGRFKRALDEARGAFLDGESPLTVTAPLISKFVSPSAMFGLEMLLLSALSREIHVPVCRLLTPHPHSSLRTSAVLEPLSFTLEQELGVALGRGLSAFKLKVGKDLDREVRALERIREVFGSSPSLRVDANRAFTDDRMREFRTRTESCGVEWLEDPTERPDTWAQIWGDSSTCLAVDEPLVGRAASAEFLRKVGAKVVVLKPMALGGFSRCISWAECAQEIGVDVVVSHLFDGPVALDAAAHLALAVATPERAQGLGLHVGLSGFLARGWAGPSAVTETLVGLDPLAP